MSEDSQAFDAPPILDLEESRRIFSADTFQKLIQLVTPRLRAGGRTLVHILPASSRFAHMVLEPWALHAMYGDEFDEIVVVIRDRRLMPYGKGVHAIASTVVSFVETKSDLVIKLGHFDAPRMENGPLCIHLQSAPELLKDLWRHRRAGKPARYLSPPRGLEDRAKTFLTGLGVAPDDPIVTLHIREDSYLSSHRYHNFRNMTPSQYKPAVQYLLNQGLWVFRLGDKTSSPLEIDHPRFVDLPFLDGYGDFLDVFLLSRARFALGCSSGPEGLARAFGTPVLLVNGIPEQLSFRNPGELIQFKRYIDDKTGQPIGYREILDRGIVGFSTANEFEKQQIRLEENSSDEILAAVQEMEARLDGSFVADPTIDAKFRAAGEDFLEQLKSKTEDQDPAEPTKQYFGLALPWTTISHHYCKANPWFL